MRGGAGYEELFRVDAKGEGEAADAPWLFEKGQPSKVIAALELVAAL